MKYRFLWCWKISKLSFCLGKVGKVWKDGKTRLRIRLVVCPDLDVIVKSMDFSTSPLKAFCLIHALTHIHASMYVYMSATGTLTQPAGGADSPLCATEAGGSRRWQQEDRSRREKRWEKPSVTFWWESWSPRMLLFLPHIHQLSPEFLWEKFLLTVWTPSHWFMKESQSLISTNTNKTSLPVHSAAH